MGVATYFDQIINDFIINIMEKLAVLIRYADIVHCRYQINTNRETEKQRKRETDKQINKETKKQ